MLLFIYIKYKIKCIMTKQFHLNLIYSLLFFNRVLDDQELHHMSTTDLLCCYTDPLFNLHLYFLNKGCLEREERKSQVNKFLKDVKQKT